MKKINFITLIILLFCFIPLNVVSKTDSTYSDYINSAKKYEIENFNIEKDTNDFPGFINKIKNLISNSIKQFFKDHIKLVLLVILICILTAFANSFINAKSIQDTVMYSSAVMCVVNFSSEFNNIYNLGLKTLTNLSEYMNITFPGLTAILAANGYETSAYAMHEIFMVITNIIALIIRKIYIPVIYGCSIMTLSNGLCNSDEINKFIKLLIRITKYSIGIMLTVFSAVLTFTGFTSNTKDSITIKTLKYAASNFVPIVGGCISDTLNSILNSSVLLKNSVGYLGLTVIVLICLVPILQIYLTAYITKILSFVTSVLSNVKITQMLETISDIIGLIGAIIVFFTIIYILMFGIVASIGG